MKPILTNIRSLHIVRGVAALLVVFFHAKYIFWIGGHNYLHDVGLHSFTDYLLFALDMLSSCGKECVILFFILSAFVIKYSYSDHQGKWGSFYKIRLLRIYLPFSVSLILSIGILLLSIKVINPDIYVNNVREYNSNIFGAYNDLSFTQVIRTIFFIEKGPFSGANLAYWSLGHELIFYLLFPFYNFLSRRLLYVAAVVLFGLFLLTKLDIFYYQVFFIWGLLLYDYFTTISTRPLIKNRLAYIGVLFIFFIGVNFSKKGSTVNITDIITVIYSFLIFDFILYFTRRKNKLWMKLGDISYTLYLNHFPLLLLFYAFITLATGKLVFYERWPYYTGVLFAVAISIPLYYLVEKPSLRLIKRFKKKE